MIIIQISTDKKKKFMKNTKNNQNLKTVPFNPN